MFFSRCWESIKYTFYTMRVFFGSRLRIITYFHNVYKIRGLSTWLYLNTFMQYNSTKALQTTRAPRQFNTSPNLPRSTLKRAYSLSRGEISRTSHNQYMGTSIILLSFENRGPPSYGAVACPCVRMFDNTRRTRHLEKGIPSLRPRSCDCSKHVGPFRFGSLP